MINIQNIDDNECFKWCFVRYLHSADHTPRRFAKANKYFTKKIDFKDIDFPVKIRGIHKSEKKNSIVISALVMKIRKNIQTMYQDRRKKILIGEKGKKHYVLIKDFNTFMYDYTLLCGGKYFVDIVYKLLVQKKC